MKLISFYILISTVLFLSCNPVDGSDQQVLITVPKVIPANLRIPDDIYDSAGSESLLTDHSLRLAHVSDIHHYSTSLYDEDYDSFKGFALNNEGRTVLYTTELLEALKMELLTDGINTLLVSGDLSVLGAEKTHLDVAEIFSDYEDSGIRVFVTPGNHDVNNPASVRITASGSAPVEWTPPQRFRKIYNDYGFSEAVMVHDETLSYLAELDEDYYLLSLDTSWYQDNAWFGYSLSSGVILPSLYDFVTDALKFVAREGRQIIVMSHHNFLEHYEIDFDMSTFMIEGGDSMMELLASSGVNLALSGHIHKTDVKGVNLGAFRFYEAALTSFALYPHTYRLIGLSLDMAKISTINLNTGLNQPQKEVILPYSWYIYYRRNFIRQYERLLDSHSSVDAFAMAEYFYLANLYSQQGLEEYLPDSVKNSKGARLYSSSESFMKGFAAALPIDSPPSDSDVFIEW